MLRELAKARKQADLANRHLIVRRYVRAFRFGLVPEADQIRILTQYPEVADQLIKPEDRLDRGAP
jgi:hypothetical protein